MRRHRRDPREKELQDQRACHLAHAKASDAKLGNPPPPPFPTPFRGSTDESVVRAALHPGARPPEDIVTYAGICIQLGNAIGRSFSRPPPSPSFLSFSPRIFPVARSLAAAAFLLSDCMREPGPCRHSRGGRNGGRTNPSAHAALTPRPAHTTAHSGSCSSRASTRSRSASRSRVRRGRPDPAPTRDAL